MARPDPTDPSPLKPLEFSVLLVLAEDDAYGYGIVKRISEEDAGGIRLSPSNLYYVLDRMMGVGWVDETRGPSDPDDDGRRRYFRITAAGRTALATEAARLAAVVRTAHRLRIVPRGEA